MNVQDECIKIHSKFGMSEMANYKIQLLFDSEIEKVKKEYEEKQKWIKVKNDYFKQVLEEDILIKFKSSLNREVIVVGHIFQGRFYMNYSNNARPLKNVMSFRYFL